MIQSLIIEVVTGCDSGQRKWIVPGQRLLVGNQEWADFVVRDSELSQVQFELRCGDGECQVEHRGQDGMTYLNGNPVQMCTLFDGDTLIAGNTRFRVYVAGGESRHAPKRQATPVIESPVVAVVETSPTDSKPQMGHASVTASPVAQQLLDSAINSL